MEIKTMNDLILSCKELFGNMGYYTISAEFSYHGYINDGSSNRFIWKIYHENKLIGVGVDGGSPQEVFDAAKKQIENNLPQIEKQAALVDIPTKQDSQEVPF